MRQPNYKLDWFIPNQVAALTHFHPDVTAEDFAGVVQTGTALLNNAQQPFHVIIDNRLVDMAAPASLAQMRQMVPYMSHPLLRWVVVVKPETLALDTDSLPIETVGESCLKNVASLTEAMQYLRSEAPALAWDQANRAFFPNGNADQ